MYLNFVGRACRRRTISPRFDSNHFIRCESLDIASAWYVLSHLLAFLEWSAKKSTEDTPQPSSERWQECNGLQLVTDSSPFLQQDMQ